MDGSGKIMLIMIIDTVYATMYFLNTGILLFVMKITLDRYQTTIIILYSVGFLCKSILVNI